MENKNPAGEYLSRYASDREIEAMRRYLKGNATAEDLSDIVGRGKLFQRFLIFFSIAGNPTEESKKQFARYCGVRNFWQEIEKGKL